MRKPDSIYVAGSSKEIERARVWMAMLREAGWNVTSTWPEVIGDEGKGEANPKDASWEQWRHWAETDRDQVSDAHVLWLLSPREKSEGAFWEMGFAHGLRRHVVISGAICNSIFCATADRKFDRDDEAFEYLQALFAGKERVA
jgi:nucleoside 2-deoxyribosyltransferase